MYRFRALRAIGRKIGVAPEFGPVASVRWTHAWRQRVGAEHTPYPFHLSRRPSLHRAGGGMGAERTPYAFRWPLVSLQDEVSPRPDGYQTGIRPLGLCVDGHVVQELADRMAVGVEMTRRTQCAELAAAG